ncbi:hypothetical protein G4G28_18550 [Massilia sp. Dwa41.01b]|uniref:hypothetical protein n=1 Tax=unclassified Massilia TaxID=2609279 RepID=UPI0015FFDF88|nr:MULTISPECIES: hypothetical protein [unclassified Massilia]QNA90000.1 hypothetical protein G4G28_18550 [Massilia sp. Dwa41.01b]QNB00885.1 hypothetical protein G4G31_22130 [Massilia sp. Se16.2.3]
MVMMLERAARRVGAALAMFTALAACDRQTAGATGQSYEIVTQVRPESLEAYMKIPRKAYDVCALAREALKLPPPPPLVVLPADFVIKRSTYLGSGKGYLIRHEEFVVDINDMAPETGCKTRIGSTLEESVGRDGKIYAQRRALDGQIEVDEPTPLLQDPTNGASKGVSYTEKRMVGGMAVRCVPAALLNAQVMDRCAADTNAGLLRDGANDPIVLHARDVIPVFDMVVRTEPVSVQVGKPVPQERIVLSKAK